MTPAAGSQKLTLKKKKVTAGADPCRPVARRRCEPGSCRKPGSRDSSSTQSGALVPDIRAEAAIIYDPKTGQVLWEQNSLDQRSIASITKVMTATVVLEDPDVDLLTPVVIDRSDVRAASTTYLRAGYKVTKDDLLHLLLIGSDNAAARALARTSPYGSEGFVARMNEKAEELGLREHQLRGSVGPAATPTCRRPTTWRGSSATSSGNERIASIMRTPQYTVHVRGRRTITVSSTNQLVRVGDVDVQAGKTGFIRSAGYCLATLLRLPQGGPDVAVVVLGAKSNAGRFWETRHLFNWLSGKAENLLGGTGRGRDARRRQLARRARTQKGGPSDRPFSLYVATRGLWLDVRLRPA